jgi:hypothetical protein
VPSGCTIGVVCKIIQLVTIVKDHTEDLAIAMVIMGNRIDQEIWKIKTHAVINHRGLKVVDQIVVTLVGLEEAGIVVNLKEDEKFIKLITQIYLANLIAALTF